MDLGGHIRRWASEQRQSLRALEAELPIRGLSIEGRLGGSGRAGVYWIRWKPERPGPSEALALKIKPCRDAARALERLEQITSALRASVVQDRYALPLHLGTLGPHELYYSMQRFEHDLALERWISVGEVQRKPILMDLSRALHGLHRLGLCHGNLKPGNVLVSSRGGGRAALADFLLEDARPAAGPLTPIHLPTGERHPSTKAPCFDRLSHQEEEQGARSQELAAVRGRRSSSTDPRDLPCAPEVLEGEAPSAASDVWAWGLLVTQTWTASTADAELPPGISDLLARARSIDPARRPGSDEIVAGLERAWESRSRRRLAVALDGILGAHGSVEPRSIGPYRVLGLLGEGGMGSVFRARHESGGPEVAVKLLRSSGAGIQRRFLREFRVMQRLSHPGVVCVLDSGQAPEGPYLVMEMLEGMTLRQYAKGLRGASAGGLNAGATAASLRSCAELIRLLCDPLDHVHGEGIVHRDIKPQNIWVLPGTETRGVKLMDFGLARDLGGAEHGGLREQALLGTSGYMAPELWLGEEGDARADLYALGVVLFELLAGRRPFEAATLRDLARQHLREPPPRLRNLCPDVPPEIEEAVQRCLQKRPTRRYQRAVDLAADLDALLDAAPRPEPTAGTRRRELLFQAPLIGRGTELERLRAGIERLIERRSGGFVWITGESGIGKTRLVEDALRAAWGLAQLYSGRADEVAARPLGVFEPILAALARPLEELGPEAIEALGPHSRSLGRFSPALAAAWKPTPPREQEAEDSEAERRKLVRAVLETLLCVAQRRPMVLQLDDLQWADELSIQVLAALFEATAGGQAPVLVLAACRADEMAAGHPLAALLARSGEAELALGPLPDAGVAELVGEMLGLEEPPGELVRPIAREAEGVPLFVVETLRELVNLGRIEREPGALWRWTARAAEGPADVPLPARLASLLGRRIDRLDPAARRAAEVAAVLGDEPDFGLLLKASGLPEEALLDCVDHLLKAVILRELPSDPGDSLRFAHTRIRAELYARLDPAERQQLHRRAAEALGPAPEGPALQELGRHLRLAGETSRAVAAYEASAAWARSVYAFEQAEAALSGALEAGALERVRQAALLRERAEVRNARGNPAGAVEDVSMAVGLCRDAGDRRGEAEALQRLGRYSALQGRKDEALRCFREAYELALALKDCRAEAASLRSLGALHGLQAEYGSALERLEAALSLYRRSEDRAGEALCLNLIGLMRLYQGRYAQAQQGFHEALERFRALGNLPAEAGCLANLAGVSLERGEIEACAAHLDQALEKARRSRARIVELQCARLRIDMALLAGDRTGAAALASEAAAVAREIGAPDERLLLEAALAAAAAGTGPTLTELAVEAEKLADPWSAILVRALAAEEEIDRGRPEVALGHARSAVGRALRHGLNRRLYRWLHLEARCLSASGRPGEAQEALSRARAELVERMACGDLDPAGIRSHPWLRPILDASPLAGAGS